eukprot:00192.XXX_1061_1399_1 [CDS] Oithona nana genome sequencing.
MEETKPQEVEAKVEGLHETLNEIEKLVEDLGQVAYENHSENESNELKAISKPDWVRAEAELKEVEAEGQADILQDAVKVSTEELEIKEPELDTEVIQLLDHVFTEEVSNELLL